MSLLVSPLQANDTSAKVKQVTFDLDRLVLANL